MKQLATLLCLMACACFHAFAQTNIDAMEYFFDSDPGFGNGVQIPVTAGPIQDLNIAISTSSLTVGFHTLAIRAKHQSGAWGVEDLRVVYVASQSVAITATLADMEYYIDTDPGPGNGTPISISPSLPALDIFPTIPTTSLSPGFHILHIRARDDNGNWGIPDARPFYVVAGNVAGQDKLVQLEYFFDTEPGYGAGTAVTIAANAQVDVPALINSASLSNGFHTISIRAKDENNQWGLAETRTFYVDPFRQVTSLEYYIDTDPGDGNGTDIPVTTAGEIDVDVTIPTTSFTGGSHTIGVRAGLSDGSWGYARTSTFTVQDSQTITFPSLPSVTYGDAPFTLNGTSSSGLSVTYTSSDPLVATISGSTVTIVGAGTTTITASQAGNGSFAPAPDVTQTLTINKASQTITFGALTSKTVGDPSFTLAASSSSTLGIAYSSSNTAVATISGSTVTIVGAGSTNITASQSGNGNYFGATDVVQPLVVVPASNPPALSTTPGAAFFANAAVVVHNSITITDLDNQISSATVAITSGYQASEDQLLFTPFNLLTGAFNATTGTLTISGAGSVTDYQGALRSVQYRNTAPAPTTGDRTISFRVSDGTTNSNVVTATITINKPPAIDAPEKDTQAGGNIVLLVDEILSDPDDNLDLSTLNVVSLQGASITIDGNIITINYATRADFTGTDEITVTICDLGGKCQTQVVPVDIGATIEVFNGISANGDDTNAYMRIRFLPPKTKVIIFNRWGDIVYENPEYDTNDPSKRFEGIDKNGKELTTGTYYYKITIPDGQQYTGYLYIKR